MTTNDSTTNTNTSAENEEQKPMTYEEAIDHLSSLEFETEDLIDGSIPENIAASAPPVAVIFRKNLNNVLEDLIEKRLQEAEEVRVDNELRYGHLKQDGTAPGEH